jgi:hypothetical protein
MGHKQMCLAIVAIACSHEETMAVFIGISKKPGLLLKIRPGEESFWCVYAGTQPTSPGDLLLIYFTAASSKIWQGIAQIYRVTSKPQKNDYSECASYRMAEVKTELLLTIPKPITMKELKAHPSLSRMNAVGRNMQGVTFVVEEHLWPVLKDLIIARNPEVDALQSLTQTVDNEVPG